MAEYTYSGIDRSGTKIEGSLNAPTEGELRVYLRQQGIRPIRISSASGVARTPLFASLKLGARVTLPDSILMIFTRQLNVLVSSGIPLVEAVETLGDQSINSNLKMILSKVKERVSQGSYFWESLAAYPFAFSKLYVSMIRAGESSGSLDSMLSRLTSYIEDNARLKRMLKGAMIYPIAVVAVGIGVIGLMMVFVIPKFEDMLKSSGQTLPVFTQVVLDVSHFITGNIVQILGGGAL